MGGEAGSDGGTLFAQGLKLAKQNLWSEAEASFIQAARLSPEASLPWLAAAIACWNQQRYDVGATCVNWALHVLPIRRTPESTQGIACFEAGDWTGVERAFRELLERPLVETPTHLFLCIALTNLRRTKEAGEHLMAAWGLEVTGSEHGPFPSE